MRIKAFIGLVMTMMKKKNILYKITFTIILYF